MYVQGHTTRTILTSMKRSRLSWDMFLPLLTICIWVSLSGKTGYFPLVNTLPALYKYLYAVSLTSGIILSCTHNNICIELLIMILRNIWYLVLHIML